MNKITIKKTLVVILIVLLVLLIPLFVFTGYLSPNSTAYSKIIYEGDQTIPEYSEGWGLFGSVINFDGIYPGWEGTVPITIVNGQDKDRIFVLSIYSPSKSKVKEGFEPFPEKYFYWITISELEVSVQAGEVRQIPIILAMPEDTKYSNKHAEVRILVEDTSQTDLIQIALETKWFIITK